MNLAPDVDAQIRNMRPTYREPIPRDSLDTKTMRRLEMEWFRNTSHWLREWSCFRGLLIKTIDREF